MSQQESSTWEESLRCIKALTEGNVGVILIWAIVAVILWIAYIHQQRSLGTAVESSSSRNERSRLRESLNISDGRGVGDMSSQMQAAMAMRLAMMNGGARGVEVRSSGAASNGGNVAEEKPILQTDRWRRFVYRPVSKDDDDVADVEAPTGDVSNYSDEHDASADGSAAPSTKVGNVVSFNSPTSTACLAFERYGILVDSDDVKQNLALTLGDSEQGEAEVTPPMHESTSFQRKQQWVNDDAGWTTEGKESSQSLAPELREQHRMSQQGDTSECSICLQEYESGDVVVQLPCKHIYHDECVALWVSRNVRCPLCNYDLEGSDSQDEPLDA